MKKIQSMDRSLKTLLLLVAAVLLVMAIVAPGSYYGVDNLRSMIFQFPEYGIIAYGMMLAMLSGGIDLSLVGIANLVGIVAAKIMLGMEEAARPSRWDARLGFSWERLAACSTDS